jgi:hypothetical protein
MLPWTTHYSPHNRNYILSHSPSRSAPLSSNHQQSSHSLKYKIIFHHYEPI